ncbi:MAG: hypothetical protein COT74_09255 [Bdellovibrionales bacterium CG10_big_fil_rev_8_21_14_0_10_45_34]|nr:MAG: hypothetical protein COT74_09255 [Bdellovibrionales bacterium CG10_big_fil_rev_8_21_14_0_10_45_34]
MGLEGLQAGTSFVDKTYMIPAELSPQSFFQKVQTRAERDKIIENIVGAQTTLYCQTTNKSFITVKALRKKDGLIVTHGEGEREFRDQEEIFCTFSLGSDRYFTKGFVKVLYANTYLFSLKEDIFKLQRRDFYRVEIPIRYTAKLKIKSIDKVPHDEEFLISNISAGGAALEFSAYDTPTHLSKGMNLEIEILAGEDFTKKLRADVRYVRSVGSRGSGLFRAGLQFLAIDDAQRDELVQKVLEIYKLSFSRFKIAN